VLFSAKLSAITSRWSSGRTTKTGAGRGSTIYSRWQLALLSLLVVALLAVIYYRLVPLKPDSDQNLQFCHRIEYWAVFISGCCALLVYVVAQLRWLRRLNSLTMSVLLTVPFFVATVTTTVISVLTIGKIGAHVWALTVFFGVFALWDFLVYVSGKSNEAQWRVIVREADETTARWLLYVDGPSAALLVIAYYIGQRGLGVADPAAERSLELVLTGVNLALITRGTWEWMLEIGSMLRAAPPMG